ncbi:unnamed protein product [Caenorhabditis auriculariae]|uniref:Uncharacterized protein n=1 Tax=Caenorhabditis auriculariae TaxID=2777116 RepID=A0A8S1H7Y0_9PELO|nr:unnamed protein product [Caenorhabditis auriculariae]
MNVRRFLFWLESVPIVTCSIMNSSEVQRVPQSIIDTINQLLSTAPANAPYEISIKVSLEEREIQPQTLNIPAPLPQPMPVNKSDEKEIRREPQKFAHQDQKYRCGSVESSKPSENIYEQIPGVGTSSSSVSFRLLPTEKGSSKISVANIFPRNK